MLGVTRAAPLAVAAWLLAAAVPSTAHATLAGDSVTVEVLSQGNPFLGPASAVVGAGPEFDFGILSIDFDGDTILVTIATTFANGSTAIDWLFADLDLAGGLLIDNVILTVIGAPPSSFSVAHTGNSITVSNADFDDPIFPGPYFSLQIVSTAVPEPATLALFAAGLGGLALYRRRRAT